MKLLIAIVLTVCITGCTLPKTSYNPKNLNKTFIISVSEGPTRSKREEGYARLLTDSNTGELKECHIVLKQYPICLLHEFRHCLEGIWHEPNQANDDDC